jgi:hypothetical protein
MSQNYDAFLWIAPTKSNPDGEIYDGTKILWHYPPNISTTLSSFQNIPAFCFPDLEIMKLEKPRYFTNEYFIFTLTNDNGIRIFGICLRTLDGGIGQQYGANRRPRNCLCFITKNPYFAMFKFALNEVSPPPTHTHSCPPSLDLHSRFILLHFLIKTIRILSPQLSITSWRHSMATNYYQNLGILSFHQIQDVLGTIRYSSCLELTRVLVKESTPWHH